LKKHHPGFLKKKRRGPGKTPLSQRGEGKNKGVVNFNEQGPSNRAQGKEKTPKKTMTQSPWKKGTTGRDWRDLRKGGKRPGWGAKTRKKRTTWQKKSHRSGGDPLGKGKKRRNNTTEESKRGEGKTSARKRNGGVHNLKKKKNGDFLGTTGAGGANKRGEESGTGREQTRNTWVTNRGKKRRLSLGGEESWNKKSCWKTVGKKGTDPGMEGKKGRTEGKKGSGKKKGKCDFANKGKGDVMNPGGGNTIQPKGGYSRLHLERGNKIGDQKGIFRLQSRQERKKGGKGNWGNPLNIGYGETRPWGHRR